MLVHFGNKRLLRDQAQAFPHFALFNGYDREDPSFKEAVATVPLSDVPPHANFICSHVISKVKVTDYNALSHQALITPP